jgi:GDPmannose 4,6-dehydratase
VGYDIQWRGQAEKEVGVDRASGRELVKIDPRYFRPNELDATIGNPAKAREKLGWSARVKFADLVKLMVEADVQLSAKPKGLAD